MPARDGTGPSGLGSMTGRGMGYCAGYNITGYANPMPGRRLWGRRGFGFGFGRGFGRGYGYGRYLAPYPYYGTPYRPSYSSTQDEKAILAEQAREIENELKAIKERISELERQPQNEEK
jgi:hypothetical protein